MRYVLDGQPAGVGTSVAWRTAFGQRKIANKSALMGD